MPPKKVRKTLEKTNVKDDNKSKNSKTKKAADESGSRPEPGPEEGAADGGAENRVEKKSLIDIYFDKLELVKERYTGKNKAEGAMLVVGLKAEEENSDDEEGENEEANNGVRDENKYSQEEVDRMRHIIVTTNREKYIELGHKFASNGQSGDGFCMFRTHDGDQVCLGMDSEIKKCLRKKELSERFDALLGLTHGLKTYDVWIHDNECWEEGGPLQKGIAALARAWKKILSSDDNALNIDPEFTRPGVEALLVGLGKDLELGEATKDFPFKWRPKK